MDGWMDGCQQKCKAALRDWKKTPLSVERYREEVEAENGVKVSKKKGHIT